jgi:hypothetical protein
MDQTILATRVTIFIRKAVVCKPYFGLKTADKSPMTGKKASLFGR